MRKILFASLAILLVAGLAFAATPGYKKSPGHGDILGQGGLPSDPGKTFRLVRYVPSGGTADSATLVTESIVVWDVISDDGVTVTTTTTSPDSAVAGIIVQAALTPETLGNTVSQDIGKRNWTWLQTHGKCEVRVGASGVFAAAGDAIGTSSTAGEATEFLPSTTDATKQGKAGFCFNSASAAADNVAVFVTCE